MKERTVRIITVLVLAIVVVGTAVACLFLEPSALDVDAPYVYSPLPRRAGLCLEPSVDGLGFLDGENGSVAKRIMYNAPYYYIFGETYSRQRDFARDSEGSAIFVALVGSAGTVFSVVTFSGADFITAKNTGEGFVVLTKSSLTAIDFNGRVTGSVAVSNAVDMYFNRGYGLAVISGESALQLDVYSNSLGKVSTVAIARAQGLSYVGMVASGSRYTVMLNTPTFPTIATVQESTSFNDLTELNGCTLTDFVPVPSGGFLMTVIDGNRQNLARAVWYKNMVEEVYVGATNSIFVKIFDAENGYFLRTLLVDNGTQKYNVAELSQNLDTLYASKTPLQGSNVLIGVFYQTQRYALLHNGSSTILRTIDGVEKELLCTDGIDPLYSTENGLMIVTNSGTTNIVIPNSVAMMF